MYVNHPGDCWYEKTKLQNNLSTDEPVYTLNTTNLVKYAQNAFASLQYRILPGFVNSVITISYRNFLS